MRWYSRSSTSNSAIAASCSAGRRSASGSGVGRRVERVAGRAYRADRVALVVGIERAAQPADMDVDRARLDIDVGAPHRVEQLLAAEHPAGMLEQIAQQAELGRAEMDVAAVALDPMAGDVHHDVVAGQHLGLGAR